MWHGLKEWFVPRSVDELAAIRFEFNMPLGLALSLVLLAAAGLTTFRLYAIYRIG